MWKYRSCRSPTCLDRDAKDGMNLERALAFFDELGEEAGQRFRSMLVFDAVIMNPDRHMGNYGVFRDNHTGRVLGFAPIFDNNLALLPQYGTEALTEEFLRERFTATPGAFGQRLISKHVRHWARSSKSSLSVCMILRSTMSR